MIAPVFPGLFFLAQMLKNMPLHYLLRFVVDLLTVMSDTKLTSNCPVPGSHLLKVAGSKSSRWFKRARKGVQSAQPATTGQAKTTSKKPLSRRVPWGKVIGAGAVFGAGAYADQAMKLRARADNPYTPYGE